MRRRYYPRVKEVMYNAPSISSNFFSNCHFFDGTILKEGEEYHYNLGINPTDLFSMWFRQFQEREVGRPLPLVGSYEYFYDSTTSNNVERDYINSIDAAYSYEKIWLNNTVADFLKANKDKYLKLVDTIGYKYNPINNYDMTETKESTIGEESVTHVVDKNGKQLTFMSNQVDLTSPTTGDMDGADAHISDWNSANKDSVSTTINTPNEVKHYTTTYDDDSNDRLEWREVQGIANAKTSQDTELAPKAQETLYNSEDYTDTRSKDNDSYELNRSGNIGVTTSQQMIEQEREVAKFNLIKEFFEDLNHYILLSTWG